MQKEFFKNVNNLSDKPISRLIEKPKREQHMGV